MRTHNPFATDFRWSLAAIFVGVLTLFGCSVNVKKEPNGEDKQVDIHTPVGGIHVSKQADVADTGLTVYPGARLREKGSDGDDKSANVNISGPGFGVKVVALEYESDDPPDKVIAFYTDQLKKFGSVLVCHTRDHGGFDMEYPTDDSKKSKELTCDKETGNNVELKVGTRDNQHIVRVEPAGKGSNFALVYVRTHGKDTSI